MTTTIHIFHTPVARYRLVEGTDWLGVWSESSHRYSIVPNLHVLSPAGVEFYLTKQGEVITTHTTRQEDL